MRKQEYDALLRTAQRLRDALDKDHDSYLCDVLHHKDEPRCPICALLASPDVQSLGSELS